MSNAAKPVPASLPADPQARTLRGRPRAVVRAILYGICRVLIGFRVEGLENVPKSGAVLVAANHLHNADPVLVQIAFPRVMHYMAKKELFTVPVVSQIIRFVGSFPVDRGKADRSAIRNAEARLKQGIPVGMFPEGTRSVDRSLKTAMPGAAMLAQLTGVPVLPIVITGSERLPFNGAKGRTRGEAADPSPGHRGVRVLFGKPFFIPREIEGRRISHDEATELLMAELVRHLPPDYHGVYAHLATATPQDGPGEKADTAAL